MFSLVVSLNLEIFTHAEEVNCGDENVNGIFETTETTVEWTKYETSNRTSDRMLVEDRQRVYPRS